jgi:hypothetical protein
MPPATSDRYLRLQTPVCRRICAWCAIDLGALTYHSEHYSYGICVACAHQFYADLYPAQEHEAAPPMLRERTVGAD